MTHPAAPLTPANKGSIDRLRSALEQCSLVVRQMEQGLAAKPLTEYINRLTSSLSDPGRILLAPLDEVSDRWAKHFIEVSEPLKTTKSPEFVGPLWPLADAVWLHSAPTNVLFVTSGDGNASETVQSIIDDLRTLDVAVGLASIDSPASVLATGFPKGVERLQAGVDPAQARALVLAWVTTTNTGACYRVCLQRSTAMIKLVNQLLAERLQLGECRRRMLQNRLSTSRRLDSDSAQFACELLRQSWEDRFNQREIDLLERVRSRLYPQAKIVNRLRNLRDDLTPDDMTFELTGKSLRLEVDSAFREQSRQAVEASIREVIAEDSQWLEAELEPLHRDSIHALPDAEILNLPPPASLDATEVLAQLQRQMVLELRYSGEIPRRTWFDWLSQGRRPVFALTMILSIVGTAFGTGKLAVLGPLLLALFLAGIVWAYFGFREERRSLLQRELNRLRDVVDHELHRLIESLLKEWQSRCVRSLRETHKNWLRSIADWTRERQQASARKSDEERQEIQEQLKMIDTFQRDQGQLQIQINRALNSLQETAR